MHDELKTTTPLITREEAALRGLSRFYTGKPCKAGHLAERYVTNKNCVECLKARARLRERENPSLRMFNSVRTRSRQVLRGRFSATKAIGCGRQKLKGYISRQFRMGMDWMNYRQWEVDHVVPLSAARSLAETISLCHFTNLQPLWKRENLIKGGA